MAETRNLCAQIPLDLHTKVMEEKNALGQSLSEYVTQILREHFEGGKSYYDIVRQGYKDCGFDPATLDLAVRGSMEQAQNRMAQGGMEMW